MKLISKGGRSQDFTILFNFGILTRSNKNLSCCGVSG
jgi:hypothetical protein